MSWADALANHYHNEVLTDITAVFLGLGKLMINGHSVQRTTTGGSCEVTHTRRVGYLDGGQLAFVYLFACNMRGIPPEEFKKGLSPSSLWLLTDCSSRFAQYFQPKFRDPKEADAIRDEISLSLRDLMERADRFALAISELRDQLKSLEIEMQERSRAQKELVCSGLQKPGTAEVEVDPCLRYIFTLRHHELYRNRHENLKAASNEIDAATARVYQSRRFLSPRKQLKQSFMQRVSRLFWTNG